jgi:hypothetical protein
VCFQFYEHAKRHLASKIPNLHHADCGTPYFRM